MTMPDNPSNADYIMHPLIQQAYQHVHEWFDTEPEMRGYKGFTWRSDAQRVLDRCNFTDAAFNFDVYFPTHFYKDCHALHSNQIIGLERLSAWLLYNPYLTVVDVGCGDGAGSVAVIDSVLGLRENGQLDSRRIQVSCVGVDPNPNGLVIYKRMLDEVAHTVSALGIDVKIAIIPSTIAQASGRAESQLLSWRREWQQPSLSHTILIMSNLTDILLKEHEEEASKLRTYEKFGLSLCEPFGGPVSAFVRQLFDGVPIDHLHMFSIDTDPHKIQPAVLQMVDSLRLHMDEKGHLFEHDNVQLESIEIHNPAPGYWYRQNGNKVRLIAPFLIFAGHIHNQDLTSDERWKLITSQENLELAWARARQETLRGAFSDEIEIRIFEQDLDGNLQRLHFELENYAVHAGYLTQILSYGFPKNSEKDRPKGLSWLEEEILMVAIIQIIGIPMLRNNRQSYAYRLSPENSPERGNATEYLYERWSSAWKKYRSDIEEYTQKHLEGLVIKTDIQSFFNRILHDRLQKLLKDELQVSKRIEWLLELLVSYNLQDHDPGRGLVQGSLGSGFLANIYMTAMDNLFPPNDAKQRRLFRYVDDIVVVVPDPTDESVTRNSIEQIIESLSLEVNPTKTITYKSSDYLAISGPDDLLDDLYERYENLLEPLWWMDDDLRDNLKNSSSMEQSWWHDISRYRSCITELGLYLSASQLSREISRKITNDTPSEVVLKFPDLPYDESISSARDWANMFRNENPTWWSSIGSMKKELDRLFYDSYEFLNSVDNKTPQHEIDKAGRRLRFAANRVGILGFGSIHNQITDILCNEPWIFREPTRLLEDLARQGYTEDIWAVFNFHSNAEREMSVYMSAIAIRALRFLPRLDVDGWQQLMVYMFTGKVIIRLMATESWLFLSANLESAPYADQVVDNLRGVFSSANTPSRRLMKNYLLILGKVNTSALDDMKLDSIEGDPLLSQAYKLAKQYVITPNPFLRVEPEIIRQKYYSVKYRHFEDRGDGSP